jgi:pimeloyl-ACP methyl ester carboxylesterase
MAYISCSSVLTAVLGLTAAVAAVAPTNFDWETITPSRKLEYHPCYEKLQCARLVVPLDWTDESNPHTVALAIAKVPAKVPEDDPSFAGTIFTNPGGPGGSGVASVLYNGAKDRDYISGNDKHYEVLSWDPRGIGFTTPAIDCYGSVMAADIAALQLSSIGGLDSRIDILRRQYAMYHAWGGLCAERAGNGSILPYLSTASVARDVVEILDKVHELRNEKKTARLALDIDADGLPKQKALGTNVRTSKKDVPRLMYWGFSYGTVLGNTFASMYPGRVGRMILDGHSDANDYYAGVSPLCYMPTTPMFQLTPPTAGLAEESTRHRKGSRTFLQRLF